MLDITRRVAPSACASFENHLLGGLRFSRSEVEELRKRLAVSDGANRPAPKEGGSPPLAGRDLERFEAKLATGRQA